MDAQFNDFLFFGVVAESCGSWALRGLQDSVHVQIDPGNLGDPFWVMCQEKDKLWETQIGMFIVISNQLQR